MIQTYSIKTQGARQLSAHFRVREFAAAGNDAVKIDEELIVQLELLYTRLNCSKIVITSGYRPTEAGSQHALGKAADVNCWHTVNGKEERYQGREILLAAEDVGIRGIGWVAGTAQSRAAVHLDTREIPYRFDEANGNRKVKDNSWYAYFGAEKPSAGQNPYTEPTALLQNGSRGDGVRWIQWQLSRAKGHAEVAVDGIFGGKTTAAVQAVQLQAGIQVDGKVGPDTRAALKGMSGGTASFPYTVMTGDSLSKIGAQFSVPWRDIAALNGIREPWTIRVGQVLTIPKD